MKIKNQRSFSWLHLFIAIGICEAAGIIGSFFTVSEIPTWYAGLVKPPWNPPSWIFGPVWTTLYALMGIAAYRVWRKGVSNEPVRVALCLFFAQLVFNSLWSVIFFGLHNIGAALIEILMLLGLIVGTIASFYRLDNISAFLLIPYAGWVSFATFLTFTLWKLNP